MQERPERSEKPGNPNFVVLESETSHMWRVVGAFLLIALVAGLSWPVAIALLGDGQSAAQPGTAQSPDPAITCQPFSLPGVLGTLVDFALPAWWRFCELIPIS